MWELDKEKEKKKKKPSHLLTRYRGFVQAAATLATNIHLPNFLIRAAFIRAAARRFCVPGLNCYSCPAATGACPIGSFQAVAGSSKFRFSYYIAGFLILFGVLLGRFICGFLCPFGWFQDLLHKNPVQKAVNRKTETIDIFKICGAVVCGRIASGTDCKRCRNG